MSHLSQTCQGLRVLIVSHGNIMVAFRIRLERYFETLSISHFRFLLLFSYRMEQRKMRNIMDDPDEKLYNGHILHYSRRDPETGEVHPHINWVRSICTLSPFLVPLLFSFVSPSSNSQHDLRSMGYQQDGYELEENPPCDIFQRRAPRHCPRSPSGPSSPSSPSLASLHLSFPILPLQFIPFYLQ